MVAILYFYQSIEQVFLRISIAIFVKKEYTEEQFVFLNILCLILEEIVSMEDVYANYRENNDRKQYRIDVH